MIRRLAKEGMTMVIVTHEMEIARNISNRVLYMDEGIIYEEVGQADLENPRGKPGNLLTGCAGIPTGLPAKITIYTLERGNRSVL